MPAGVTLLARQQLPMLTHAARFFGVLMTSCAVAAVTPAFSSTCVATSEVRSVVM
jgi:hypothetical protein